MNKAFKKSYRVRIVLLAASAIAAICLFVFKDFQSACLRVMTPLLAFALGFVLSKIIYNAMSLNENMSFLSVLYVELNPEKFIEIYAPVVDGFKKISEKYTSSSYITDAYLSLGMYEKALEYNERMKVGIKGESLESLDLVMTLRIMLLEGRNDEAEDIVGKLYDLSDSVVKKKGQLAAGIVRMTEPYRDYLDALSSGEEPEGLVSVKESNEVTIRRLEAAKLLEMLYQSRGDGSNEERMRQYILKEEKGCRFEKKS